LRLAGTQFLKADVSLGVVVHVAARPPVLRRAAHRAALQALPTPPLPVFVVWKLMEKDALVACAISLRELDHYLHRSYLS